MCFLCMKDDLPTLEHMEDVAKRMTQFERTRKAKQIKLMLEGEPHGGLTSKDIEEFKQIQYLLSRYL